MKQMISNRFYICITLLAVLFISSSCLSSDDDNRVDYDYSSDAQITSLSLQSYEDSLKVLPSVKFSINQVASAPVIFNRDSLPYLFDVSNVKMNVATKGASGIKLHLINPDSTYIWDMNDSVKIKSLKHIEVYAADGITTKMYSFRLNTHQQDPDTIFWQNVANNYIDTPTDQVTIANANNFYTYYKIGVDIALSTYSADDGETWTEESVTGLPQNVVFTSIQNDTFEEDEEWYALDTDNNAYLSEDGIDWEEQVTDLPVISIFGKMPSYSVDSVLVVVKDEDVYRFAKTMDFSSLHLLNEIPAGFPVDNFATTTIKDSLIYTAKYLLTTGGVNIDGMQNNNMWLLQENEGEITYIPKEPDFNVTGSSLFKYDDKIYLLTPENGKNVF
ncbi:MAG: hypothetical protein GX921_08925, partial [Bacteroidales bacterium]|nr:hypothetical protein [Bacteroidales bacterium]